MKNGTGQFGGIEGYTRRIRREARKEGRFMRERGKGGAEGVQGQGRRGKRRIRREGAG